MSVFTANKNEVIETIDFCVKDLRVDAAQLESFLSTSILGATTREIQVASIVKVVSLATAQDPDWLTVAGRLNLWCLRKCAALASAELKEGACADLKASSQFN